MVVQMWSRLFLKLMPNLAMCKNLPPHGSGFEGMEESWRADEAQPSERPGEAVGEDAVSVVVETPGWKGSWRQSEVSTMWHGQSP